MLYFSFFKTSSQTSGERPSKHTKSFKSPLQYSDQYLWTKHFTFKIFNGHFFLIETQTTAYVRIQTMKSVKTNYVNVHTLGKYWLVGFVR